MYKKRELDSLFKYYILIIHKHKLCPNCILHTNSKQVLTMQCVHTGKVTKLSLCIVQIPDFFVYCRCIVSQCNAQKKKQNNNKLQLVVEQLAKTLEKPKILLNVCEKHFALSLLISRGMSTLQYSLMHTSCAVHNEYVVWNWDTCCCLHPFFQTQQCRMSLDKALFLFQGYSALLRGTFFRD